VPTCFVLVRALGTLDNLCHSVPLELICKPNSLTHIRLSLVPKRTKQVSGKLVALQPLNSCYRVTSQCEARLTLLAWFSVTH
jgi:hypothetical protein